MQAYLLSVANAVVSVLLAGLLVSAWHAALWKRTRSIAGAHDRRVVQALSVCAALVLWMGASIPILQFDFTASGTWFCRVCAECEERLELLGLTVHRGRTPPEDQDQATARPFQDWFARVVALEHAHDWEHSGCHRRGSSTVACTRVRGEELFYASLPRVPDQATALALVTALTRAPRELRGAMLEAFQRDADPASPFVRLQRGQPLTAAEFAAAYADWLARQPLWR